VAAGWESDCKACDLGMYANVSGLASCSQCQPGKFADHGRAWFCKLCQVGKFNSAYRKSSCEACSPGRFEDRVGTAKPCQGCVKNTYMPDRGSTACLDCHWTTLTQLVPGGGAAAGTSGGALTPEAWLRPNATVCDRCIGDYHLFDPDPLKLSCVPIPPFDYGLFFGVFFLVLLACFLSRKAYR
jgi:hypothetical protein